MTRNRHTWLNVDGPDHRQCQECGIECRVGYDQDNRRTVTWSRDGTVVATGSKTPPCKPSPSVDAPTNIPDLPQAAIDAAAAVIHDDRCAGTSCCTGQRHINAMKPAAIAALTAALPLLGEIPAVAGEWVSFPADQTRTEYAVQVTRDGHSHVLDDLPDTNRVFAERGAEKLRGYKTTTAVVQRPVWRGEWTESTPERTEAPGE